MRRNALIFTLLLISLALIATAAFGQRNPCQDQRSALFDRCFNKAKPSMPL